MLCTFKWHWFFNCPQDVADGIVSPAPSEQPSVSCPPTPHPHHPTPHPTPPPHPTPTPPPTHPTPPHPPHPPTPHPPILHVSTQHPALLSLFPHSWEALSRHDSQASTQVFHVNLSSWWLPVLLCQSLLQSSPLQTLLAPSSPVGSCHVNCLIQGSSYLSHGNRRCAVCSSGPQSSTCARSCDTRSSACISSTEARCSACSSVLWYWASAPRAVHAQLSDFLWLSEF